jgi:hypothetical protein
METEDGAVCDLGVAIDPVDECGGGGGIAVASEGMPRMREGYGSGGGAGRSVRGLLVEESDCGVESVAIGICDGADKRGSGGDYPEEEEVRSSIRRDKGIPQGLKARFGGVEMSEKTGLKILSYSGEEPAAWIWWDLGFSRKAMAVRLEGFQLLWRLIVMVRGKAAEVILDFSLWSRRTTGA